MSDYAWGSFNLFVGTVLSLLAAALTLAPRRSRATAALGVFLALVATNYIFIGLAFTTGEPSWAVAAYVALAMDPIVLLLFVHTYPFERFGFRSRLAVLLAALSAGAAVLVVLVWPAQSIFFFVGNDPSTWQRYFVLGNLGIVYAAAWLSSVHAMAEAPTASLRRRAVWAVAAVGITTLPRVALLAEDWSLWAMVPRPGVSPLENLLRVTVVFVQSAISVAALAFGAYVTLGPGAGPGRSAARRQVLMVSAAALVLFALAGAFSWWRYQGGPALGTGAVYAFRWLVFVPLLVQGILRYEIIELDTMLQRWMPRFAGAAAFAAGALATGSLYADADRFGLDQALAVLGVGLGVALVAAWAARTAGLRWIGRRPLGPERATRLEVYRAALEAAFARDEPGPELRRRLERHRRGLGISPEEALAVEHMVARHLGRPRQTLHPGDEPVPGLVIDVLVGEGSEGRVFLAHRPPRRAPVVVKELRLEGSGAAGLLPLVLDRLRRLRHPGLPRLLEAHVNGETPLIVFEYVSGQTLDERLRTSPVGSDEAGEWIAGALDPLGWLHERGMLHRDLKPAHLIRDPEGRLHLLDLGLLQATAGHDSEATIRGLSEHASGPVGTLAYMSPEVARRQGATPASDLYAMGLIAYRMVAGQAAVDLSGLDGRSALALVASPNIDYRAAPVAWRAWLRRALDPDPAERFATASAMRAALPRAGAPATRRRAAAPVTARASPRPATQAGSGRPG